MKTITARITMTVNVTDEEYEKILKKFEDRYDVDVNGDLLRTFKDKGFIDEVWGDSYIPGPWLEFYEYEKGKVAE